MGRLVPQQLHPVKKHRETVHKAEISKIKSESENDFNPFFKYVPSLITISHDIFFLPSSQVPGPHCDTEGLERTESGLSFKNPRRESIEIIRN